MPDVVVTQPQRLPHRQLEHLLQPGREGHVLGGRCAGRRKRGQRGRGHGVLGHPGGLDRAAGEPLPLGEQAEDQVQAGELAVAPFAGVVLRLQHHHLGAVGEAVHRGVAGDEALLDRLLGHPHALADQRPGGAGPARLVDEVPDQVVGELAELVGDGGRLGEVVQGGPVRVAVGDLGDQHFLVESRLLPVARRQGLFNLTGLVAKLRGPAAKSLVVEVVEAMATNKSFFFRDKLPFVLFRDAIMPALLSARTASRRIRIWCAAAATGQEPYSLAIALKEMGKDLRGFWIEIAGEHDFSAEVLEKARSGIYSQFEVQRGLPGADADQVFLAGRRGVADRSRNPAAW